MLGYGIPEEWLSDVREATEDTLFDVADHLPAEAAEALLERATGSTPLQPAQIAEGDDPFTHPDARRRFRVMTDIGELKRALDFPWEKWTVFLHPAQRDLVKRDYGGPARISGSACTGKAIVALHRAVHLAKTNANSKVLLTTFSLPLASKLRRKLGRLIGDEPKPKDRIAVREIDGVGLELYETTFGTPSVPNPGMLRTLLRAASGAAEDHRFSPRFLESEWSDVVDAWQLESWEAYRDVARLGREDHMRSTDQLIVALFERVVLPQPSQTIFASGDTEQRIRVEPVLPSVPLHERCWIDFELVNPFSICGFR